MSRIGKTALKIPTGVEVSHTGGVITVKGPKGTITKNTTSDVTITVKDGEVLFAKNNSSQLAKKLWGTYASHTANMIEGVTKGFKKQLIIEGVGFKSELKGDTIIMRLGFSHPVEVKVPKGLSVAVKDNKIDIEGCDKEMVGQFAANVRGYKEPEPYKGKGIRYSDEVIRRKQGKKATA